MLVHSTQALGLKPLGDFDSCLAPVLSLRCFGACPDCECLRDVHDSCSVAGML